MEDDYNKSTVYNAPRSGGRRKMQTQASEGDSTLSETSQFQKPTNQFAASRPKSPSADAPATDPTEPVVTKDVEIHKGLVGCIIGKGGSFINKVQCVLQLTKSVDSRFQRCQGDHF